MYETLTQNQVVYKWFSTMFHANMRSMMGKRAADFRGYALFPGMKGSLHWIPGPKYAAVMAQGRT
jgi:hypothetical protein